MKFSLVVATLNRSKELLPLLDSLNHQRSQDLELIVVDQNRDERIHEVLKDYKQSLPIVYLRFVDKGLSKARNLGLKYVTGDVIAFPDDDCWYPQNFFKRLVLKFELNPGIHGFTGRAVDENCENLARFAAKPGMIHLTGVWERSSSVSVFLKKEVIDKVGRFDEALGVGSETPWGGGEDIDYPIRAIKAGFKLYYDPEIYVYHPRFNLDNSNQTYQRVYTYSAGIGRVMLKHNYPTWLVVYYLLRPIGGMLRGLVNSDIVLVKYHWFSLIGRWRGSRSKVGYSDN